ncbi:DUF6168 family protein [Aequorivita echinoideorum]|uniref:ATP synthase protein I n=1 Tax=Aequorivita echinoideorum TaxID=1549647 RepID=A0ABS5S437_9FLAO|nr:DUF6168 family protein [Aequorivita echinoideorum]MBT0607184.1 hypothetical protein [Aequorivita echinoideorum]
MKIEKPFFGPVLLIFVTAVLFFVHRQIVLGISEEYTFFYDVWKIYLFHFIVTSLILLVLYFVGKKVPDYVGFTFLGFILLKMVAAIAFLIPLIKMENVSKIPDFISFFAPYFIYLFIEIILTLRLLRQSLK